MNYLKYVATLGLLISSLLHCVAQDPVLPPSNLGLANLMDGIAGPPGILYQNYNQFYETRHLRNASGHVSPSDLKIDPLLSMHQLIWLTPVRLLGGNLGFTVLLPIVKISATSRSGSAPPVNPSVLGDLVQGTAIQWSGKKIFGKPLSHRIEVDLSFPTGSYDSAYAINTSAHLYTFSLYHTFTFSLAKKLNISARNQFNYNTSFIGAKTRPGAFYNGNYSVEFQLIKNLWLEAVAYYLHQFNQDAYNGNSHYYQQQFNIADTREETLGLGGGLAFLAPGGILVEGKMFTEAGGKNRTQGFRPTLRLAIPLTK